MSNDNEKITNCSFGGGFFGMLTITFIVLKLCNVIDWSWFWVLSPLYPAIIVLFLAMLFIIIALIIK